VAGYCVPHTISYNTEATSISNNNNNNNNKNQSAMQLQEEQVEKTLELSSQIGIKTISSIPCFCDIQFLRREFLTALKYPQHPFAKQIQQLIDTF
jgi:hypothetical protein